jgi:kynurenine formamidase
MDTSGLPGLAELLGSLQGAAIYDLSQPFVNGMTAPERQPGFRISLLGRHGDLVRPDGVSAAYEMYTSGTHVGTHMDAACHISVDGRLGDGTRATEAQRGGRFSTGGIEDFGSFVSRGVLLDIARLMEVEYLPGGFEVTDGHLTAAADVAGVEVHAGDAVMIRTGMGRHFGDPQLYLGHSAGVPGVGVSGAEWIKARSVRYAGTDTSGFDRSEVGGAPATLPSHALLLGSGNINIIENLFLEDLAAAGAATFLALSVPLRFDGATGAPVRPLALVV